MDEGVDPQEMCQSLVNKVERSKQLSAIADPDLLFLFEDWLEELEDEVLRVAGKGPISSDKLAEKLGISRTGASFLMTKLRMEKRM